MTANNPFFDLIDALAEHSYRTGFIGFQLGDPHQPRPRIVGAPCLLPPASPR